MLIPPAILVPALLAVLLAGCQKKDAPLPETAAPAASMTTPAATPSIDAAPAATEEKK